MEGWGGSGRLEGTAVVTVSSKYKPGCHDKWEMERGQSPLPCRLSQGVEEAVGVTTYLGVWMSPGKSLNLSESQNNVSVSSLDEMGNSV